MGQTVGVKVVELVIAVVGDQVKGGILLLKVIVQPTTLPTSPPRSSLTTSRQVPFARQPFNKLKDSSGEKFPLKGAVPDVIEVVAVGVKQVLL